jgi:ribosomal protein S25
MDFDKAKDDIDKWFDGKTQEEIQNIVDDMDKVFKKINRRFRRCSIIIRRVAGIMANINYPNK